jgi:hypothetical protein
LIAIFQEELQLSVPTRTLHLARLEEDSLELRNLLQLDSEDLDSLLNQLSNNNLQREEDYSEEVSVSCYFYCLDSSTRR